MVSILDADAGYYFPEPFPLYRRLADVLETDVLEKYYLSQKAVDYYHSVSSGGYKRESNIISRKDKVSCTILASQCKAGGGTTVLKEFINEQQTKANV